jgi:hypothetical protein
MEVDCAHRKDSDHAKDQAKETEQDRRHSWQKALPWSKE